MKRSQCLCECAPRARSRRARSSNPARRCRTRRGAVTTLGAYGPARPPFPVPHLESLPHTSPLAACVNWHGITTSPRLATCFRVLLGWRPYPPTLHEKHHTLSGKTHLTARRTGPLTTRGLTTAIRYNLPPHPLASLRPHPGPIPHIGRRILQLPDFSTFILSCYIFGQLHPITCSSWLDFCLCTLQLCTWTHYGVFYGADDYRSFIYDQLLAGTVHINVPVTCKLS